MRYDKLVRDRIPEIIESRGEKAVIHIADEKEYEAKLKEKLLEEVREFIGKTSIEELADIMEVIEAICEKYSFDKKELERVRTEKKEKRGGFSKKIILEES